MLLRLVILFVIVYAVHLIIKSILFKYVSVSNKVKDLKKAKSDVRSSLADEEEEIISKRKILKEARKEV